MNKILTFLFVLSLSLLVFTAGIITQYYTKDSNRLASALMKRVQATERETEQLPKHSDSVQSATDFDARILEPSKLYGNYNLITYANSDSAYLVDMQGRIIHRWDVPYARVFSDIHLKKRIGTPIYLSSAYVFPNGDLIVQYSAVEKNLIRGYGMAKVDKDGKVLWTYFGQTHHTFHIDDNTGDIYTLAQSAITIPSSDGPKINYPILADYVVRLSADGKEQGSISLLEAFNNTPYEVLLSGRYKYRKSNFDLFHSNSIMLVTEDIAAAFPKLKTGQIIVNSRNIPLLYAIDPVSGKVVWATRGFWNMALATKFLPNGHILYFDSLGDKSTNTFYSKAVEFDPLTNQVLWYFLGNEFYPIGSDNYGDVLRLPNGNTLISSGTDKILIEVTSDQEVVWKMKLTASGQFISSIHRYTKEALPFATPSFKGDKL